MTKLKGRRESGPPGETAAEAIARLTRERDEAEIRGAEKALRTAASTVECKDEWDHMPFKRRLWLSRAAEAVRDLSPAEIVKETP